MSDLVVFEPMHKDEARRCIDGINNHLANARLLLLELYERRGWEALGYNNWRECVVAEFEQSQTHLYRLLQTAKYEREISPIGEIGTYPESHIRALIQADVQPEDAKLIIAVAKQVAPDGKPTAATIKSMATVLKEVTITRALDDGSGEQIDVAQVFKAAVLEETSERMLRHEQHIKDHYERQERRRWKSNAHVVSAGDGLITFRVDQMDGLPVGKIVHLLIYEQFDE